MSSLDSDGDHAVNNVGVSYDYPEYYDKIDEAAIWNLHRLNIDSTAVMTHMVLPQMVSRSKGAIINVSSGAGAIPMGLLSIYSASKAYVDFFSRALQQEYEKKGIFIQSVLPFMVVSKLSKVRKPSALVPTANQYVRAALSTVGSETRTFGFWSHKLQWLLLDLLPASWSEKYLFGTHAGEFKGRGDHHRDLTIFYNRHQEACPQKEGEGCCRRKETVDAFVLGQLDRFRLLESIWNYWLASIPGQSHVVLRRICPWKAKEAPQK